MKYLITCLLLLVASITMAQNTPVFDQKEMIAGKKITAWNFTDRPAGWYRIAKALNANLTLPLRANATFELRENADHSTLRFEVGVNFNSASGSSLTITSHSFFSAATFTKLRLITSSDIYGDMFLEVYIYPHNNNNQTFNAYLINPMAESDWLLENWEPGAIPAGYNATEFDADKLLSVGNIRQGNILSVGRNGYVGIGTDSPSQKLSVTGTVLSSVASNEGGSLFLENPLKTDNSMSRWALYNMAGSYGNGLQFWRYSQNGSIYGSALTIADNGNVGIGTNSPGAGLDVTSDIYGRTRILSDTFGAYNGNGLTITTNTDGNVPMVFKTASADRLTITGNGNVGIGTNSPGAGLDVTSDIYGRTRILSDTFGAYNGNGLTITTNTAGNVPMVFKTASADRLTITGNGNVGIGTAVPDEKLTVNGKIMANEIRVNGQGAPDYVFDNSYKVVTLEEVEGYIKKNKHLPDMPSAKEFERDGIAVGEMNKLLLKKIEELTLYMIELKKENNDLKDRMDKLDKKQ